MRAGHLGHGQVDLLDLALDNCDAVLVAVVLHYLPRLLRYR